MKLNEAYPSKYISAADLQGREPTVVIATVDLETIGDSRKLVLTFQGKKKAMVCNKTNADRIGYMYGDETDEWIGREIVLYSELVTYGGKTVEGLRVKPPQKRTPPPQQQFTDRPINGGGRIMDTIAPPTGNAPQPPRGDNPPNDEIPF